MIHWKIILYSNTFLAPFTAGTLCGLAIYNSIIINLPFPLPLYKKILNEPMTLDDFIELDPVMGKNLRELLLYEGDDVEEVMCLNFTLDRVYFDEVVSKELKPGGADIPVTNDNRGVIVFLSFVLSREEYVQLIVDYILTKSIEEEFSSFCAGFERVCGGDILRLFQPVELMSLVVGNEDYDWDAFKSNTSYKGEYSADHETIVTFWSVFDEMALEDKKKFLLFLTGCDRVPLLGMRAIKMVIEPVQDSRLLPVAHTCVHQLDLPKYGTKERLKYKLLQAIQHYEGFGLV
ncbi:hypothetical protein HAZT_HAZT008065 [Hyalella azteca]|uniref:HECT-type E3 ubiquitin transferase n=1 Tax=Hyalella azteca TaxID=294128 RepID=A0A6A0GS65_HYAAZ|nr:hypothetical protein HAZT_HAZT008065 [Hyalella azteca]